MNFNEFSEEKSFDKDEKIFIDRINEMAIHVVSMNVNNKMEFPSYQLSFYTKA